MAKKSRLRIQKANRGRRALGFLAIGLALGLVGFLLARTYGLPGFLRETLGGLQSAFSDKVTARGTFYDRNLKQLAVTLERVSVYARTRELGSIPETAAKLAEALALNKDKLENQLTSGALRVWIAQDISQEQEGVVNALSLPGVYLQRGDKRFYPNEFQAAHLLGVVENGIGLSGVEYRYDRLLNGGAVALNEEARSLGPVPDLVLTIDMKIQDLLDDLAREILAGLPAGKVAVYVVDPDSGELVGGANLPGFNPNNFTSYSQEQTENIFMVPMAIPEKFRIFLRDAAALYTSGQDEVSSAAWSVVATETTIGAELQFWEWLGVSDVSVTDFYEPERAASTEPPSLKALLDTRTDFDLVPEVASPLSLLTAYSTLLGGGQKVHPFVVKKLLDAASGREIPLDAEAAADDRAPRWFPEAGERVEALFRSMATPGPANSAYFTDSCPVVEEAGERRTTLIEQMAFVTLPAGTGKLAMLAVTLRPPPGVSKGEPEGERITRLLADKLARISNLQQIAKSVADVVELEEGGDGNYQDSNPSLAGPAKRPPIVSDQPVDSALMPDLRGLSLRKSLQLLQGRNLSFTIRGTGRVLDQKPPPGSSLKGVTECEIILQDQERIVPKNMLGQPADRH